MIKLRTFGRALLRRKPIDPSGTGETQLNRCLTTFDLTTLGIGSTLGLGIYVLAGQVASQKAGPAVVLSFLIAGIASIFAGLCYAEFGARVPKAGSAYIYSYVTVGEFMAFIIGWNLILEYVIGTASVARGYSGYIDSLINGTIQSHLTKWMPMHISWLSDYPDIFAFAITFLLTLMLAVGVKESTRFNSIFTVLNLVVVAYVVIVGAFKVDINNWKLPYDHVPHIHNKTTDKVEGGNGGFFPFGITGMMSGAATCFYGYVGFDAIATTGEEVKNPRKAIPISIVISLIFISLAYSGVSLISTLIWPYYDQNNNAPLPYIFEKVGYPVARWIIVIGAIAGLSTSLLGGMFPLPRIFYAMGSDRLIYKFLANVSPRFKTPVIATIISGIFAGAMAALFNVSELADMMSIGTLMAYSLVATSVLILRYQKETDPIQDVVQECDDENCDNTSDCDSFNGLLINTNGPLWKQIFNSNQFLVPNELTSKVSISLISGICFLIVLLNILLTKWDKQLYTWTLPTPVLVFICLFIFIIIIGIIALSKQPKSNKEVSFKVPWVPLIPLLSIFANINLMCQLTKLTWYRFAVWMTIGFIIYFTYGIFKSVGYMSDDERKLLSSEFTTGKIVTYDNESSSSSSSINACVNEIHEKETTKDHLK